MNTRRRSALRGVALSLVFGAVLVAARPARHLAQRTWTRVYGRVLWVRCTSRKDGQEWPSSLPGRPIAWLKGTAGRLDTIVLAGARKEDLHRAPCWSPAGAAPGTRGLKLISAHRDMHFRPLRHVTVDDRLQLELPNGTVQRYRVADMEVVPRDLAAARLADKASEDWLVLMTCHPFRYAGPAPNRFLVWCRPVLAPALSACYKTQ